jgi:outer membrane protein OmpA-like peptidoglycan-associated protein
MKKVLIAAAAIAAFPAVAQAQEAQTPGVYLGIEGGLNWMFNTKIFNVNTSTSTPGWAAGGKVGYDFLGPRVEIEGMYRETPVRTNFAGTAINGNIGQASVMANVLYDFNAWGAFVPYIGAGAGVAFIDSYWPIQNTQFAYQGILGVGYNFSPNLRFSIDGRYFGTTNPGFLGTTYSNNNISVIAGIQVKFGSSPTPPPPPPPMVAPPSFMVFFDWDRSNLSQQALTTIKQAADAFKTKGNARITATGHTDTSGPEAYNMALSLRRANTVKDALVREGVPAQAITVIGRGEAGLLVQTGDGVREPQNRRVEIVIQ